MKSQLTSIGAALILLCVTGAWCQTQDNSGSSTDTQGQQTQPGPKQTFSYPDATPSLDFLSGAIENSGITLGLGGGFAWDSYGYPSARNSSRQSRIFYQLSPSIKLQQYRSKVAWDVGYTGSWQTYSQPNSVSNGGYNSFFGQTASGDILWQFAPHWQLHANDGYTHTANPFSGYTIKGNPTINNPNPGNIYPLTQYEMNSAVLGITNQLSARDTLDFVGTADYRHTNTYNIVTAVPFYNMTSYGGRASYNHQVSARLTVGGSYEYQSLDFSHGMQRTGLQMMTGSVQYQLRPHMSVSGWIGPEYTSTKTIIAFPFFGQIFYQTLYNAQWSTAAGGSFGWQGLRNSVRAGASRQVGNGSGLLATTQSWTVSGGYQRQINRKWSGSVGVSYWDNRSVTVTTRRFAYTTFNADANWNIYRALGASFYYLYLKQNSSNIALSSSEYNDNRVGVSLHYSWYHPLGR